MDQQLPTARFARYELLAELGRGGMAVVYEAFDRVRGAAVAMKCLSVERFSIGKQRDRMVALFEREYYALSQLAHPQIIRVYDYALDQQGPYYTMDRLVGESLRARVPWPWREACARGRDIASALALLHSRSLVHRDVTPLNIHCDPDGRAKLIDFGAMIPAGVARHLVGTPAFIAPESMRQQSLDGRADLFALGGCLYFAITGEYAYPARNLDVLHAVWQIPPPPLSRYVSDVPEALEELVLALLSIDRDDRPRTAAEVYERLTTIADLPRDEAAATAQAYLSRPALVGRGPQLDTLREHAQASVNGRGGSLLLSGVRGVGRSCMLDAAALEATLCGLRVARADAASGDASSLGVVRQLLGALTDNNPALSRSLDDAGVTTLISEAPSGGLDGEIRARALEAVTQALLEACKHEPLALIVDDVHAIDETSCAVLAGLSAQALDHRLLLVCSIDRDVELKAGSASALLSQCSRRMDLRPLSKTQSRELLASLFDDVLNIDMLAAVADRRCQGNPRLLMDAAQRLIDQGLAKYEGGSWLIAHAPDALSAAINDKQDVEHRLRNLSADAVELLETVAFDRHGVLDLSSYLPLLTHRDSARMHRGLSDLVEAHWVELAQDRINIKYEDRRDAVLTRMPAARHQQLHIGLAERCVELALPAVYEAHHRLGAGDAVGAVAALDRYNDFVEQHPHAEVLRDPITLETTEAISRLRGVPGMHPAMAAKYLAATALNGTYRTLAEFTAERLPAALAALAPFSGLQDYAALAGLSEGERLTQALTAATQRCAQPGLGAIDVVNALVRTTQLSVATGVVSNFMADAQLLEALPDLTPFRVLSPALDAAAQAIDALSKLVRGQTWLAWDALLEIQRDLRGPRAEQIEPLTRMVLDRVAAGYLCELSANFGTDQAVAMIDEYAQQMPDLAASDRTRLCLAHGDLTAAAEARRRFEVVSVRTGGLANARIIELPLHLTVYAQCGDIIGLRRTHRAMQEVARTRPGYRSSVDLAQAQLLRCRGGWSEGLRVIEALLSRITPPHVNWQLAAATDLELLIGANRCPEAIERGRDHLASALTAHLPDYLIASALAKAYLAMAEHDQAEHQFGRAIAQLEKRGARGVVPGCVYELGARIAMASGDAALFRERVEVCGEHFRLGRHPDLTARHNALRRAGVRAGQLLQPATADAPAALSDTLLQSLEQLANKPLDNATFYRGMLDMLLEGAAAIGGVLYVKESGVLRRVAMAGAIAARPDLDSVAAKYCAPGDGSDTSSVTGTESSTQDTESGILGMYALDCSDGSGRSTQGVLMLEHSTVERPLFSQAGLNGLGALLAERARLRSSWGEGSQARTTVTQLADASVSEQIGRDPATTTDR